MRSKLANCLSQLHTRYVWDRPDTPLTNIAEKLQAVRKMKEGPEKIEAMKRVHEEAEVPRVFLGKNRDRSAVIVLSDPKGKPRISMTVDLAGNPKLAFLDERGKIVYMPPSSQQ